jgi:hypothetical protein
MADPPDQAQLLHACPDNFEGSQRNPILAYQVRPRWQELIFGIFDLDPDGQERHLVVAVAWEYNAGQVVQALYAPA